MKKTILALSLALATNTRALTALASTPARLIATIAPPTRPMPR